MSLPSHSCSICGVEWDDKNSHLCSGKAIRPVTEGLRLGPDPLRDHMTKTCNPTSCAYCKKRRRIADEEAGAPPLDSECLSCPEGTPENECPSSRRQCGHHCNCSWVHDHCHWCDAEFGEDGGSPTGAGDQ